MMQMVHELPGTTFSSIADRGSYDSGVSIEVVRRRLGHASAETTQVYTLPADKVADAEIRAARRRRGRSAS
jgi:integrase